MQVSGSENHHVRPWIEYSAQQGTGDATLGPASEIGGFSFAGLMRQEFAAAAAPATAAISPSPPAVESAPAPAAAVSKAGAAVAIADQAAVAAVSTVAAAASAPPAQTVAQSSSDGRAPGTGLVTSSGAPLIVPNAEPAPGSGDNAGPAAYNPYYGTAASPLVEGNVVGYDKWFQSVSVGEPGAFTWAPAYSATADGAQEALRLAQQYVPGATIQSFQHNGQIGNELSYNILLPDGRTFNAGLLLDAYYHQGTGVNSASEGVLQNALDWPVGAPPPTG